MWWAPAHAGVALRAARQHDHLAVTTDGVERHPLFVSRSGSVKPSASSMTTGTLSSLATKNRACQPCDDAHLFLRAARQRLVRNGAARQLQAQLWPTTRSEIDRAREDGIDDIEQVFSIDDLAPTEVIVAATGVSNGDLLRGVRYGADSARTHSLVMCTRCNWVRFVDGIHFFARERREEVRLL